MKKKNNSRKKTRKPWYQREIPRPFLWGALVADLIALAIFCGKALLPAAAWLTSPAGLVCLLLIDIVIRIVSHTGK